MGPVVGEQISNPRVAPIQVRRALHNRLWRTKREREAQEDRVVSFNEIIEDWRMKAEAYDRLIAEEA